jgi:hypothetical protein
MTNIFPSRYIRLQYNTSWFLSGQARTGRIGPSQLGWLPSLDVFLRLFLSSFLFRGGAANFKIPAGAFAVGFTLR